MGDTPVPIPNTTVKTHTADGTSLETVRMVLHWRRCGRAGGRQNKKKSSVQHEGCCGIRTLKTAYTIILQNVSSSKECDAHEE